jgi:tetratricopeptide (TPR) repeat protein
MRSSYIAAALPAMAYMAVVTIATIALSPPAAASMRRDLASCTAAQGRAAAAACTRVMNSGRLPRKQFYIGYFNRGAAYRRAGDLDKALADFNRVVALRPHFSRGYHVRGLVRYGLGDHQTARKDIDRAIELDAQSWPAYFSRAVMQRAQGEADAALKDLATADDIKRGQAQVLLLRALIKADRGAVSTARAEVNKVIATGKDTAAAYYARATIAYVDKRYDAAQADLDKALKRKATFAAAQMLMGRILEARADRSGAMVRYRKALAAPSNSFDGLRAHETARARLDALEGAVGPSVALNNEGKARSDSCRHFLPATGMIIEADCDDK